MKAGVSYMSEPVAVNTTRLLLALALSTAPLALARADAPAPAPITLSQALASQAGSWSGKLEYRDYSADKWFGLPVKVSVRDGGDGVTLIRIADFDDGPKAGIVRITTISMLGADGLTEYSTSYRKGRVPELSAARLQLTAARDLRHWTIVATETSTDDDRPATIRVTTTRNGAELTSLKEVDFTDDAKSEWLVRNRTTLVRVSR